MSSRMRTPARGSVPPRPPTETWTPSTILPLTLTLQPCSPMSAVWWLPHEAGHPDQRTLMGRVAPIRCSSSRASAMARVLVSMRARLQKSVPVQETTPRITSDGLYGSSRSNGSWVRSPTRASGTWGMITFWSGVTRSSPLPVRLRQPCQLEQLIGRHPAHRGLEAHVVQARLLLAEDADVVRGAGQARVAAGGRQRALQPRLQLARGSAGRPTPRSGRPAGPCCAPRAGRGPGRSGRWRRRPRPPPPAGRRRRAPWRTSARPSPACRRRRG